MQCEARSSTVISWPDSVSLHGDLSISRRCRHSSLKSNTSNEALYKLARLPDPAERALWMKSLRCLHGLFVLKATFRKSAIRKIMASLGPTSARLSITAHRPCPDCSEYVWLHDGLSNACRPLDSKSQIHMSISMADGCCLLYNCTSIPAFAVWPGPQIWFCTRSAWRWLHPAEARARRSPTQIYLDNLPDTTTTTTYLRSETCDRLIAW